MVELGLGGLTIVHRCGIGNILSFEVKPTSVHVRENCAALYAFQDNLKFSLSP